VPDPRRLRSHLRILTGIGLAVVLVSCGSDDAGGGATDAPASSPASTVARVADDCPLLDMTDIAGGLDVPTPELLQANNDGCVFSIDDEGVVGSISVTDEAYGRGLMKQFESYGPDGLEAFGLSWIEGIDGAFGTYSVAGFTVIVGDSTYQLALDGPEVDRSSGMLALIRLLVETSA